MARRRMPIGGDPTVDHPHPARAAAPGATGGSANLLVDGNCEAAGVAAWTPDGTGVPTKTTSSPHGGAQALRLTVTADNGGVLQSVCTAGLTYRLLGYARGNGTGRPGVYMTTTGYIFTGTSSTSWQAIDASFTAQHTDLKLWCLDAGQYADFDDLVLVRT